MDWHNELYVRLYKRTTTDDLLLSWEARALWHELLKKFDRSGILTSRRGASGLAALVGMPMDVIDRALAELLEDGRLAVTEGGWFAPNFMAAQETPKSNALRQKEVRDRRRMKAGAHLSHDSHDERSAASHGVAPSHSEKRTADLRTTDSALSRGTLSHERHDERHKKQRVEFAGEYERRPIPEEPGTLMVLSESGQVLALIRTNTDGTEEVLEDRTEQLGLT